MRAMVLQHRGGALVMTERQVPEPGPGQVLLRVRACAVCRTDPRDVYGDAGGIIEVHHLEPLALLSSPRPYDPVSDLVPLCPCCHRAVHTKRPVPHTPDELAAMMRRRNG